MNDHRVDIRDIQARLDDRRGHQYIDLPVDEIVHDPFQFVLFHLSVGKGHVGLRHQFSDCVCHLHDRVDPVIDIVDLTASGQLPADGLPDHLLIVFHHIGLNRYPLPGCLL